MQLTWMVTSDPSAKVRERAIGALFAIYSPLHHGEAQFLEKKVVAAVERALKDKSKDVRLRAANALSVFGPAAKPAIPALVEALKEKDLKDEAGLERMQQLRVSCAAADSLGRIGPDAKEAIPALVE